MLKSTDAHEDCQPDNHAKDSKTGSKSAPASASVRRWLPGSAEARAMSDQMLSNKMPSPLTDVSGEQDPEQKKLDDLMRHVQLGQNSAFHQSLHALKNVNLKDKYGRTLLMQAASVGSVGMVSCLLGRFKGRIDLELRDGNGWSALRLAVWQGHLEVGELLIKAGANLTKQPGDEVNLFQLACYADSTELIHLLSDSLKLQQQKPAAEVESTTDTSSLSDQSVSSGPSMGEDKSSVSHQQPEGKEDEVKASRTDATVGDIPGGQKTNEDPDAGLFTLVNSCLIS